MPPASPRPRRQGQTSLKTRAPLQAHTPLDNTKACGTMLLGPILGPGDPVFRPSDPGRPEPSSLVGLGEQPRSNGVHENIYKMATTRSYLNRIKLKTEALARAGIWPSNDPGRVRPNSWLGNFTASEEEIAAALIDVFVYFSDEQVTQLLRRALTRLFQKFGGPDRSIEDRKHRITNLLSRTLFVPVEGESPNPTDSGNYLCRCVRQTLELSDSNIASPAKALSQYIADDRIIVFVDDMVGTGNQMRLTWDRQYAIADPRSFRHAFDRTKRNCYYICLVCSSEGRSEITSLSGIDLISAHDLENRDRVPAALARISDHPAASGLQAAIDVLLTKYANQLILDSYMRPDDHPRLGFGNLGLTLGFQHSIPDATLPIYWASGAGSWTPMTKRA